MHLSDLVLELSEHFNPYDFHRRLWQLFELPSGSDRPFQFRADEISHGSARVLMQSNIPIMHTVDGLKVLRQTEFEPHFRPGQKLRFRLKANPIKTIRDEKGRLNGNGEIKSCRVPLMQEEQQVTWLARKLENAAKLGEVGIRSRENIHFRKGKRAGKIVAVTFEGELFVEEQTRFLEIFATGIGPAKGLGCGMLSLAVA